MKNKQETAVGSPNFQEILLKHKGINKRRKWDRESDSKLELINQVHLLSSGRYVHKLGPRAKKTRTQITRHTRIVVFEFKTNLERIVVVVQYFLIEL